MFEARNYFGTVKVNGAGAAGSSGDTRPSKRRRIVTPDPGPPLTHPPPPLVSDPGVPPPPDTSAIDPDKVLAGRWTGCNSVTDLDEDFDFEGHPIPQPMEISDEEESEFDSDEWWDDGIAEDLLEVLETNIELDACRAGVLCLHVSSNMIL